VGTAVKIGVIGAGSAVFSLGLIRDLCLQESLWGSTVSFVDLDPERLEMIHRLATRYAAELGVDLRFEQAFDRTAALRDAQFVINTAARSHADEESDRAVGEQNGYYRGIRICTYRNLALMLAVARDVERVCPDAWLIQSGNPVFDGCTLMTREVPGVRVIGLCHGHYGYREIAGVLGLDPDRVRCLAPGLNHCIFAMRLEHDGQDLYPVLDEWIANRAEEYWASYQPEYHENQMSRGAIDLYRLLGLMPIGDTVRITGWRYHVDLATKKHWFGPLGGFDSETGWARYLGRLSERVERIFRAAADPSTKVTEAFPPTRTSEQQVPIIDALVNNHRGEFQVNVPNRGAIEGIPDDVVVEVPAVISGWGVQPIQVGALPRRIMLHTILPKVLEMERNLEAFRSGDRRMLLSVLLWDHRTRSVEQAEAQIEAILAQPHNRDMAEHFRRGAPTAASGEAVDRAVARGLHGPVAATGP
jgi:alpha-galactosidase